MTATGSKSRDPMDVLREERGARVRDLRRLLRLSRPAFSARYGITFGSLQNWEQGRYGGLTERGARRLAAIYQSQNIPCTAEWLLYAVGDAPPGLYEEESKEKAAAKDPKALEKNHIAAELALFQENYEAERTLHLIVPDASMAPMFQAGDHIAGVCCAPKRIQKAIGLPCIAELNNGEMVFGMLDVGETQGCYDLTPLNLGIQKNPAACVNISLAAVAPILWVRRKREV